MKTYSLIILSVSTMIALSQIAMAASTERSDIKDHNYICMHITKPEALVFKTTAPQKIWKTAIDKEGAIKKTKAIQLGQIQINADNLNGKNKVATFKAELAAGYQIRGLFQQETDGELPLTVVSSYLPDGITNPLIKEHYNCELQSKQVQLGTMVNTLEN